MNKKIQHVYIIGSKGIPAKYGGFETFVEKLTEYKQSRSIQYHVACMNVGDNLYGDGEQHFEYNQADCFNIAVPNIGPARAIYYDVKALDYAIELAKKNSDIEPIFYILACRIGPFLNHYKKKIKKIKGKLYVNPDGHEWLRAKWSYPVRRYWKFSEKLMVKHADLMICDSLNIEKYIKTDYEKYTPKTTYIAYGTDIETSKLTADSPVVREWFSKNQMTAGNYYLVVGRFVPENNYEIMIREFMKSSTNKDFVLITNIEENTFYKKLQIETQFQNDNRIKFVGTVYDQELLKYIRENAFAYLHGHEVGGTNPSLLEALALTKLNLLLDVSFNQEVGRKSALYWEKTGGLSYLMDQLEQEEFDNNIRLELETNEFMKTEYSWDHIINSYETLWSSK